MVPQWTGEQPYFQNKALQGPIATDLQMGQDIQEWLEDQYKLHWSDNQLVSVQARHCVSLNFYFPEWNSLSVTYFAWLALSNWLNT